MTRSRGVPPHRAAAFEGTNGGERIQAAIAAAHAEDGTHAVVWVGPDGPDEGGRWTLSEPVVLPGHTTLVLAGATLFLADGAADNALRNEAATVADARDEEIHVVGLGDARIDGNAAAQHGHVVPVDADQHTGDGAYDYFRRNGIDLYKVDRFSLRGFTIGPTNAYAIAPEDVTDGLIADVRIAQNGTTRNQDAINLGGPAQRVQVANVRGAVADGAITVASRGTATSHKTVYEGGDVRDVFVRDCLFEGAQGPYQWAGLVHTWPHDEATLERVRCVNVAGRNLGNPAYRTAATGYVDTGGAFTQSALHRTITLDGLYTEGTPLVDLRCDVADLTIRDARLEGHSTLLNANGNQVDGLAIENCAVTGGRTPSESVEGKPDRDSARLSFDGTFSNVHVTDLTVRASAPTDGVFVLSVPAGATIEDARVTGLRVSDADGGVRIDADATVGRLTFDNCRFEETNPEWVLDTTVGVLRDGVGVERREAREPSDAWEPGDIVAFEDANDGSERRTHLRLPSGEWSRLD